MHYEEIIPGVISASRAPAIIISHKYRFIFLKTAKTAGTSTELALSRFCGPQDIITALNPDEEQARKASGIPGPQNQFLPPWKYRLGGIVNCLTTGQKAHYYNHIPAREVRWNIGKRRWNSYYKFCVARNPWDRCVSDYYWQFKNEPRPGLSEYLDSHHPAELKDLSLGVFTIKGKVAVDRICRYENLAEELEEVRAHLGLPAKLDMPRAKSEFRKDKRHYREIIGQKDQKTIAELFRDEIELLAYEW